MVIFMSAKHTYEHVWVGSGWMGGLVEMRVAPSSFVFQQFV